MAAPRLEKNLRCFRLRRRPRSRFWSVNETLEHIMLTGELMARLSADQSAGKRRNLARFPDDFMFQLTRDEARLLRSQIATLDIGGRGLYRKYWPYAFTEHGVAMLSSVLRSPRAIAANIEIMRAFIRFRSVVLASKELAESVYRVERTQVAHETELGEHAVQIHDVFAALRCRLALLSSRSARQLVALSQLQVGGESEVIFSARSGLKCCP